MCMNVCIAVCVVKWYRKMILRFCFLFLSYKYLYLKPSFYMPSLRTLKLYPTVFLFTHRFYTTNHVTSDPSYDWYFGRLSYYVSSERSYICACVFFWSERAFVFPILFMNIYFSCFCCLYIPIFWGSSYSLQNRHSAACHFISELTRGGCQLFPLVQATFMLRPCPHIASIPVLHCLLTFMRLSSERRVT